MGSTIASSSTTTHIQGNRAGCKTRHEKFESQLSNRPESHAIVVRLLHTPDVVSAFVLPSPELRLNSSAEADVKAASRWLLFDPPIFLTVEGRNGGSESRRSVACAVLAVRILLEYSVHKCSGTELRLTRLISGQLAMALMPDQKPKTAGKLVK